MPESKSRTENGNAYDRRYQFCHPNLGTSGHAVYTRKALAYSSVCEAYTVSELSVSYAFDKGALTSHFPSSEVRTSTT